MLYCSISQEISTTEVFGTVSHKTFDIKIEKLLYGSFKFLFLADEPRQFWVVLGLFTFFCIRRFHVFESQQSSVENTRISRKTGKTWILHGDKRSYIRNVSVIWYNFLRKLLKTPALKIFCDKAHILQKPPKLLSLRIPSTFVTFWCMLQSLLLWWYPCQKLSW